jgi:hypothetical protein
MAKTICAGCGLIFTGLGPFDRHRVGEHRQAIYAVNAQGKLTNKIIGQTACTRRCLTVEEIQALGMVQNDSGWWGTELDEAGKAYFEGLKQKKVAIK